MIFKKHPMECFIISTFHLFQTMRKQLLGKFRAEKDKMPAEKKTLVLTHFPRFLSLLEEEIYGESPIWDPEFRQAPPPHVQQMNDRLKTSSDTDSFRYIGYHIIQTQAE